MDACAEPRGQSRVVNICCWMRIVITVIRPPPRRSGAEKALIASANTSSDPARTPGTLRGSVT